MALNKTVATDVSVADFLAAVPDPQRREDCQRLQALFADVTGWRARMWGSSIVGYGQYHYVYASGREGDYFATGFSPRAAGFSIYIMPGYADFADLLAALGKHRAGKSCLNIKHVADIDLDVLAELVRAGIRDLARNWPVCAS